jgi:hypothetical protein
MDDFLTEVQEEDVEEHPARLSRDTIAELLRYVS